MLDYVIKIEKVSNFFRTFCKWSNKEATYGVY